MTVKPEHVLHELQRDVWPVPDPERESERRRRIGARILEAQREVSTRRRRRRSYAFVLALAAIVGGLAALPLVWRPGSDATEQASGGASVQLLGGQLSRGDGAPSVALAPGELELPPGAPLVTASTEGAALRLSSDTRVEVAPASALALTQRAVGAGAFEERLNVYAGSVRLSVPKLGSRGTVRVQTPDALVEVHGTRFGVRYVRAAAGAGFTEVDVSEGRVLVRSGGASHSLGAGDRWSSAPEPAQDARASELVEPRAPDPPAPGRTLDNVRGSTRASDLAEQNRLLEAAELAQRNGMPALALERLETLVARHPEAELAHNARVLRFRIWKEMGRDDEAVAAAREYLRHHPRGFARAEAERLIGELSKRAP